MAKGVGQTSLLGSYEAERRPVAAALLKNSGRTTKFAMAQNSIAAGIRVAVAQTVPHLQFLHQRMAQSLGMLDISYADSPISKDCVKGKWLDFTKSVAAIGTRVPHHTIRASDGVHTTKLLMEVCSQDTRHNLLVFCSPSDLVLLKETKALTRRYENYVNIHVMLKEQSDAEALSSDITSYFEDFDLSLATKFGIAETGFILVRPDQHFSFRSSPAEISQLAEFLNVIFV